MRRLSILPSLLTCCLMVLAAPFASYADEVEDRTWQMADYAWDNWQSIVCTSFPISEGYPSKVNCIYPDKEGYVWLGAENGLYMLTGGAHTRLTYDPSAEHRSIPGNTIHRIQRDSLGTLWVLTNKGMAGYPPRRTSTHFAALPGIPDGLEAFSVAATSFGTFFGSEGTLWRYDYDSQQLTKAATLFDDEGKLFKVDEIVVGKKEKGLMLFDRAQGSILHYLDKDGSVEPLDSAWSAAAYTGVMDYYGRLWISNLGDGIRCIDPESQEIFHCTTANSDISSNSVLCMAAIGRYLVLGTDRGGICILNIDNGKFRQIARNSGKPSSIPSSTVTTLAVDDAGNIWAGGNNGGPYVLKRNDIITYNPVSTGSDAEGITFMLQDDTSENIWVATFGGGLFKFDPSTGTFTHQKDTEGLTIYTMCRLNKDELVFSCPDRGFLVFNENTGTVRQSLSVFDIGHYYLYGGEGASLANDEQGRCIFYTDAILRWDDKNKLGESFKINKDAVQGHLHSIFGSHGHYSCDEYHIYLWDGREGSRLRTVYTLSGENPIRSAVMGINDDIWLALGDKVGHFRILSSTLELYDLKLDSRVKSLLCDDSGRVWIGTLTRLYMFNPDTGNTAIFGQIDGVRSNEFTPHAKLIARDGSIYMGGNNGLVRISPDFKPAEEEDIQLSTSIVFLDEQRKMNLARLKIPADHGSLEVWVHTNAENILGDRLYNLELYRFRKLSGTISDQPSIKLRSLRAGGYRIMASCTKEDGSWTRPQEVLSFRVEAHWYGKWWFILGIIALAWFSVGRAVKYSRRQVEYDKERSFDTARYDFMVNSSEELRTPLYLTKSSLKSVMENSNMLAPETAKSIRNAQSQVEQMELVLKAIVTTSKIQAGLKPRPQEHDLNQWVSGTVDKFRDAARLAEMEIVLVEDVGVSTVRFDKTLCQVVLDNLLMNAIKHNIPGRPITVRTEAHPERKMVRVLVRDHGNSIGEADMSKLFLNYYQRPEESAGFGVSMFGTKAIIDEHHGYIGAYNNSADEGVTFWFELPS